MHSSKSTNYPLLLYDNLRRQLTSFIPRGEEVSLYVCGITPYDTTHLGHAFTYVTVDILVRFLTWWGLRVRYVQNVTDIDDDILRKAKAAGEDWQSLGNRWTQHFIDDMQALNVLAPEVYPRATDVIPEIIEWIRALLEVGVAYEAGGSVYFDVSAWPGYGCLACMPPAELLRIANERGNNPDDPNKRHPLDFVLWQAQAPGEPAWESPWGPGRPGWHIECSTMAGKYLGKVVDIHAGGSDLLFPHHDSEIAQVEPISQGQPFVRCWMHIAMVRYRGEKMSKSLGNLVMVRDLLGSYSPDAIRLVLAWHHYRQAWRYEEAELARAQQVAEQLKEAARISGGDGEALDLAWERAAFGRALATDLDAPTAALVLEAAGRRILRAADEGASVDQAQKTLRELASILGLRLDRDEPEARVTTGWGRHRQRFAISKVA